eukprot:4686351-Alexandrium_andersonii.AAC.1
MSSPRLEETCSNMVLIGIALRRAISVDSWGCKGRGRSESKLVQPCVTGPTWRNPIILLWGRLPTSLTQGRHPPPNSPPPMT